LNVTKIISDFNELSSFDALADGALDSYTRARFWLPGLLGVADAADASARLQAIGERRVHEPRQLEYFRQKLLRWRAELLAESSETLQHLKEESLAEPDLTDRASLETERAIELRTRDRERKLISKIDAALMRIEDGSYGYCEETDEPISLRRLEARPIATLSLEAQERHERMERTHRDD
jgi:DnaK suppressor protein